MLYRINSRAAWQKVGDQVVVVDLDSAKATGFNNTGSLIWSLLEEHEPEAIAAVVAERYDVDPEIARTDVLAFIERLRNSGFITLRKQA